MLDNADTPRSWRPAAGCDRPARHGPGHHPPGHGPVVARLRTAPPRRAAS
ncbi:hypothetical protein NQP46_08725 [Streptomyces albus]|nr:hypothetical protein NQP46_08725 [Streptomyces albus]